MAAPSRSCILCGHDLPALAWRCPGCKAPVPRTAPPIVAHLGIIAMLLVGMILVWRLWAGDRAGALLRALLD